MLARVTLCCFADEQGIALVTGSPHTLQRDPAGQFFPGQTVRHCQGFDAGQALCLGPIVHRDRAGVGRNPFPLCFLILGFLHGIPRALLTTRMLATFANLFRTERGRTSMASTVYTHPNLFLNPFGVTAEWGSPFADF